MAGALFRSLGVGFSRPVWQVNRIRSLSTGSSSGNGWDGQQNWNSHESIEEFERRIFGGSSDDNPKSTSFFAKLDRLKAGRDSGRVNDSNGLDGLDESFNTLHDGMDEELEEAASYFEFDPEEVDQEDYSFRPDVNFVEGGTYDIKDLDLTKPGVSKPFRRDEFEVTTEEVLRKADFRNVRFLANFITDAGIIIKRSQTRISAKAQRKVAREIKTARAFGLMPFTTMGTKSFIFGRSMESLEQDYEYDVFDDRTEQNDPREV